MDQAAGTALKEAGADGQQAQHSSLPQHNPNSAFRPPASSHPPPPTAASISASASVPSNLNTQQQQQQKSSSPYLSQLSRNPQNPSTLQSSTSAVASSNGGKQKRDKDEELFEFLNSPDNGGGGSEGSIKRKSSQSNIRGSLGSGRHSRQSSVGSTVSNKSGKISEAKSSSAVMVTADSTPGNSDDFIRFTYAFSAVYS